MFYLQSIRWILDVLILKSLYWINCRSTSAQVHLNSRHNHKDILTHTTKIFMSYAILSNTISLVKKFSHNHNFIWEFFSHLKNSIFLILKNFMYKKDFQLTNLFVRCRLIIQQDESVGQESCCCWFWMKFSQQKFFLFNSLQVFFLLFISGDKNPLSCHFFINKITKLHSFRHRTCKRN